MFGTYRMLLALMVVFHHLGGVEGLGGYAVFGFFVLSGYLMTLVLHASYGYSPAGVGCYALNRFLRIYPVYWLACLVSVLAVLWLGSEVVTAYHGRLFLPSDTRSLLRNLLILFEHGTQPRLVPPAWALTVELFFYACMGLGFSRTRGVTLVWFAASAVYTVYVNLADLPWAFQYYLVPAASLPFATGALIYHYEEPLRATFGFLRHHRVPLALFALVLLNFAATRAFGTGSQQGFYANYALHALLVASLAGRQSLPGISRRLDDRLGDFSYPIYLVHLQAGLLLVGLGIGLHRRELPFALVSLPVIFLLSWLLTAVVERPIETLRQRIKGSR